MRSVRDSVARASILLIVLQLATQGVGFLKQILVASQFGTSATMDAYVVATTVIGLILLWVTLPTKQLVIPVFRHNLARQGEPAAWEQVSILLNNLVPLLIGVVVAGALLAPYLVGLLAPGFDEETDTVATALTRITVVSIVFLGIGRVLSQILFSYGRFFLPGSAELINNLVVIIALLVLGRAYGIYGLAVATVLGAACECAGQLPILWDKWNLYQRKLNFHHPAMHEMRKLGLPLLLSNSGVELARITDRIFASLLSAGSLSALAFGHRLTNVLLELLVVPLQQSTFPHFTKLSAEENFHTFSRQHAHYLRMMFFLTLPIATGLLVIADPLVRVLYQRG
ncbi:MAG: lipid II flippase MurJ, partial [Candidatus Binatia bacterium]